MGSFLQSVKKLTSSDDLIKDMPETVPNRNGTRCQAVGKLVYLLPDIAIPEITVQVNDQQASARELENTVVKPIRQQLTQVAGLSDIHSETRDGAGLIRLSFDFGTNTDLAFIEVNEKIDAALNYLPREVDRPRVV